ncbi:MAG: hypothetical protein OEX01_08685 [Candidatus Bathyarchaeota archaeon]|nr:hypothetical protein [Candidatus Bathyarchaeota archaeon]
MKDHIYPRHMSSHSQIRWYAKLTHIGGRRTESEIDLVVVEGRERVFAYEFKFLRGKTASYNYKRIYQGLGQALLYFWYGFDRSTLCIGRSMNLDRDTRKKINMKIRQVCPVIDEINKSMPYFGWLAFFESKDGLNTFRRNFPKEKFPIRTDDMRKDREAIIAGNVRTNGKPFLRRYGLTLSNMPLRNKL